MTRSNRRIQLPPPADALPPWFVPRPEPTERLLRALHVMGAEGNGHAPADAASLAVLHGPAGIGKTTLAAALLRDGRLREHYPDGVLWATLGPQAAHISDADPWLLAWGRALGLDLTDHARTEARTAALAALLADRRVLVVVDDVWAAAPALALLSVAGAGSGRLAVAARADLAIDGTHLALEGMSEAEAQTLLTRRAGKQALTRLPAEEPSELCQRLGGVPLALHLVGTGLRGSLPAAEYLGPLRAQPGSDAAEEVVRYCLEVNGSYLEGEDYVRYGLLSVLPEGLPITATEAGIVWGLASDEDPTIVPTLQRLSQRALLQPVMQPEGVAYRQHPLLRRQVLDQLPPAMRQSAEARHIRIYMALAQSYDRVRDDEALDTIHAQTYAALQRTHRIAEGEPDLPPKEVEAARLQVSGLVFVLREYWEVRGLLPLAARWDGAAAEHCRALGDQPAEAAHLANQGMAYAEMGDLHEAVAVHEQALTLARRLGDRHLAARQRYHLGLAARDLGHLDLAREHLSSAFALHVALNLPQVDEVRRAYESLGEE